MLIEKMSWVTIWYFSVPLFKYIRKDILYFQNFNSSITNFIRDKLLKKTRYFILLQFTVRRDVQTQISIWNNYVRYADQRVANRPLTPPNNTYGHNMFLYTEYRIGYTERFFQRAYHLILPIEIIIIFLRANVNSYTNYEYIILYSCTQTDWFFFIVLLFSR